MKVLLAKLGDAVNESAKKLLQWSPAVSPGLQWWVRDPSASLERKGALWDSQRQQKERQCWVLLSPFLALGDISCPKARKLERSLGAGVSCSLWFKCLFAFGHISQSKEGQNAPVSKRPVRYLHQDLDALVIICHPSDMLCFCTGFWPTQLGGLCLMADFGFMSYGTNTLTENDHTYWRDAWNDALHKLPVRIDSNDRTREKGLKSAFSKLNLDSHAIAEANPMHI